MSNENLFEGKEGSLKNKRNVSILIFIFIKLNSQLKKMSKYFFR